MACPSSDAVVILGTSRSDGNTLATVNRVLNGKPVEFVDLSEMNIGVYDYEHANSRDSFLPLIERLVSKSLWLLATPVYWYTMDLGRSLRGKAVAVIASGTDEGLPQGFEAPFRLTCDYLGMRYVGVFYLQFGKDDQPVSANAADARAAGASWIA